MNIKFIEYKNNVYSFQELDDDSNVIAIHHTTALNQNEAEAELTALIQNRALEQLKAEKKAEILQGFEDAKNVLIKVLANKNFYLPVTDYVVNRIHKLRSLRHDVIELELATKENYVYDKFKCYDASDLNNIVELKKQTVNYLEIAEISVAVGNRVTDLESQRDDKLDAADGAINETELLKYYESNLQLYKSASS